MTSYGIVIDLVIYIQSGLWFFLIGYLTYLTLTTKLTHVDEFRQRFLLGLSALLTTVSTYIILRFIIRISMEENQYFYYLGFMGIFIFIISIISGYAKLKEYVSSLIDFEEKHYIRNSYLISLILAVIVGVLTVIIQNLDIWTLNGFVLNLIVNPIEFSILYFSFVYSFSLHQEMKKVRITLMIFFGFGFLCLAFVQIPGMFLDAMTDILYGIILNCCILVMISLMIYGYLDFKNRLKKINEIES